LSSDGRTLDAAAFSALECVAAARTEDGAVEAQVEHLHDALPALLNELERQGQPLTELRVHSATLEDVFVALTGRRLRDE
jgi:ABC-2 type transport system ATP-binding protein